jgi:PHD/YefM family antitoxin component YafN of YafNO toxin-antitoxin module
MQESELQLLSSLQTFTATTLANKITTVTKEIIKRGSAVITSHNEPTMIVMSVDRYIQLKLAAKPNLDALTEEFDALYAKMQEPGVMDKTIAALDLDASK